MPQQSNQQPAEDITLIRVHGDHLAVGDVLGEGVTTFVAGNIALVYRKFEILEINDPVLLTGWGRLRTGLIRWLDTDTVQEHIFRDFSLRNFSVVAGPKLDAARRYPELVEMTKPYPVWRGVLTIMTATWPETQLAHPVLAPDELQLLCDAERNRAGVHVSHIGKQAKVARVLEDMRFLAWKQSAESDTMGKTGDIYVITETGLSILAAQNGGAR